MGRQRILLKRICASCGRDKTRITKEGYESWYPNKPTDLWLCHSCFTFLFTPKERTEAHRKKHNPMRMTFKGKTTYLGFEPRIGVCNWCPAVKPFDTVETHMHHDENRYDDNDILRYTIELCEECHGYETVRLENLRKSEMSCYGCGTGFYNKRGWFYNRPTDFVLCRRCYRNLVTQERRKTKL